MGPLLKSGGQGNFDRAVFPEWGGRPVLFVGAGLRQRRLCVRPLISPFESLRTNGQPSSWVSKRGGWCEGGWAKDFSPLQGRMFGVLWGWAG